MFELSEERLRNDEMEIHCYGFSSSQIYLHYRESIDNRLKILMLDLSNVLNEMGHEAVNQMLIEQYKAFWAAAEPSLNKFYEEIQGHLALPKNFVPKDLRRPEEVFCESEITKLEREILSVEQQYLGEIYYLHALQQRKEVIEKKCLALKTQIDLAAKIIKENMIKMEHFDVLDKKRGERMEKYLEGLDRKMLMECMCAEGKSEAKQEANLKNFKMIIEKNKNESMEDV